jgi:hypothetical protein
MNRKPKPGKTEKMKVEISKKETMKTEIKFLPIRNGTQLAYSKNDYPVLYSNKTQAYKKCNELNALGYDCFVGAMHPFKIILNQAIIA